MTSTRSRGRVAAVALALILGAFAPAAARSTAAESTDRPEVVAPVAATAAAAQTLTWTADDSTTAYASVTTSAAAGPATIVFENSEATGNTSGMQHTLTFDTVTEGYNHDVDLNIVAYPSDDSGGRHTAEVVLSPGTYRFFCSIPGHGQMTGELVVTDEGGGGDDTTAPTVTPTVSGDKNADGDFVGSASVELTATDDSSGVAGIEYDLDGAGWTPYTAPLTVETLGDHTVRYRATDAAGNVSEPGSTSFTIAEGSGEDTTPPAVTAMVHGTTNADGAYVGQAEVMLTSTDTGSGVASTEYALDGGAWTAYGDPFVVDTAGDHTVAYRATDEAGNVSEPQETTFTVVPGAGDDTDAPAVTAGITGDQAADWSYRGKATVTLTATDEGSGVAKVEYSVDDRAWTGYTSPVVVDSVGGHTVRYRATDAAGNVSDPGSLAFRVSAPPRPQTCAYPDPSPTVVVGDVGSGVRNRVAEGACTIDDLIADEARWQSHADFVAHVRDVLAGLYADGLVSGPERRAIVTAAEASGVGGS